MEDQEEEGWREMVGAVGSLVLLHCLGTSATAAFIDGFLLSPGFSWFRRGLILAGFCEWVDLYKFSERAS